MRELENILKSIKNKEFLPVYFFHGEEPYFMDIVVKALEENVLREEEKIFNQTIIYGKDTNYREIISTARQVPMMLEKQLIVVKEAQDLLINEEAQEIFIEYIKNPVKSTVLVFTHKHRKIDSRKKMVKILQENKCLFLSEPLKCYGNELPNWIQNLCNTLNIKIAPNVTYLLAEYLGNDLSRISRELEKLKLVLRDHEVLDIKIVEKHIGISKDYNVFELQDAIGTKNPSKAMKIASYMGKNMKSNPLVIIIGNLFTLFSNIITIHSMNRETEQTIASLLGVHPFIAKRTIEKAKFYPLKDATRVISILREIDLKSKGLGTNQTKDNELLVELVYKILNVNKIKL